jgi:hypothetical protein
MGATKFSTTTALALAAVVLSSSTTVFAVAKLPKHSVGAKQLKTSAVTNPKIAKHAITSSKVKPNALGGTAINESALGQVPSAASAGNATRLEGKGAASFVGAPRMAFGKGNAVSTAATTVLTLPNVGMTVTTDGDIDTDPVVVVNLPATPGFSWVINSTAEDQTFSTKGGSVTLGAPLPATTTTPREFTAHIWRSDTSAGIYLHCMFDTDNFSGARPLSCWAFST